VLTVALFLGAAPLFTAGACAFVLVVTLALVLRRPTAPAKAMANAAAAVGDEAPGARFADVLDALPDPILVVTGAAPEDLTGRRFIYANASARELFQVQRDEGPLATAVRAPEVLESADEALFGGIASEAIYEAGGAQGRVWS